MPTRAGGPRWSLMIFLIAPITFVMSLDRTAIAVAAPTIQHEYGFTLVEMSVILTSFSWTYAPLQVPGGWLAERCGRRGGPDVDRFAGAMDRKLVKRDGQYRDRRRGGRGTVAVRASATAIGGFGAGLIPTISETRVSVSFPCHYEQSEAISISGDWEIASLCSR